MHFFGIATVIQPGGFTRPTLLDAMNAPLSRPSQLFAIGAALSTLSGTGLREGLWSGTGGVPAASLTLEVESIPIPTAIILMGSAITGLGLQRRKAAQLFQPNLDHRAAFVRSFLYAGVLKDYKADADASFILAVATPISLSAPE